MVFIPQMIKHSESSQNLSKKSEVKVKMKVTQSCPTLCDPMDYHQLPKLAQTNVHLVGDAIQPFLRDVTLWQMDLFGKSLK